MRFWINGGLLLWVRSFSRDGRVVLGFRLGFERGGRFFLREGIMVGFDFRELFLVFRFFF